MDFSDKLDEKIHEIQSIFDFAITKALKNKFFLQLITTVYTLDNVSLKSSLERNIKEFFKSVFSKKEYLDVETFSIIVALHHSLHEKFGMNFYPSMNEFLLKFFEVNNKKNQRRELIKLMRAWLRRSSLMFFEHYSKSLSRKSKTILEKIVKFQDSIRKNFKLIDNWNCNDNSVARDFLNEFYLNNISVIERLYDIFSSNDSELILDEVLFQKILDLQDHDVKGVTHIGVGQEGILFSLLFPSYRRIISQCRKIVFLDINEQILDLNKSFYEKIFGSNVSVKLVKFNIELLIGMIENTLNQNGFYQDEFFGYLLSEWLKKNEIGFKELLKLMGNDVVFMLKTFDLLHNKLKYQIVEFLLKNLYYKLFVLSFSIRTLSGKTMHYRRRELWLESMCKRLNLNYNSITTKTEMFYLIYKL